MRIKKRKKIMGNYKFNCVEIFHSQCLDMTPDLFMKKWRCFYCFFILYLLIFEYRVFLSIPRILAVLLLFPC